MRKFVYSFSLLFAGLFAAQSFAQPRDLFAEFEAEAEAAQSSETVVSSSSAAVSSSSVAPSSAVVSSSSKVPEPVDKPVEEPSSSSVASSSSVLEKTPEPADGPTALRQILQRPLLRIRP